MSASGLTSVTTGEREVVFTRVLDAPRDMVFTVWTDPKHVARWWGPRGFTTTTERMDVRAGGSWRFCMHGPDGRDYENLITYLEVERPRRLVYKHGGDKETEPVNFQVTVTFDEHGERGAQTKLTMRMIFPSAQALQHVVKTYGALEGGKQNVERLVEYLGTVPGAKAGPDEFVISRVFAAPREVVFKAWTDAEHLQKWFGPKGSTITRCTMDLRPGGVFHYAMRTADGREMWGKWTFREIDPPCRVTAVVSFSDEHGGMGRHPMSPDWPREILSVFQFDPHAGIGGGTVVTIRWSPINATEVERRTFENGRESMQMGWTGTLDRLAAFLDAIKEH